MDADPAPDASALAYPVDVERRWIAAAHALAPRSTENESVDRLADVARRLSNLFTTERPVEFPDYAAHDEPRLAYGLLFFPQAWVRTRIALAEAVEARGWRPAGDDVSILDLGAGLGAAGLGAAQFLLARGLARRARLVAVDRSRAALGALKETVAACPSASRGLAVETHAADLKEFATSAAARADPVDLVVVSFALNEAFAPDADDAAREWIRVAAGLLRPGGLLLVLEPALRETATRLRSLVRPLVKAGGLSILAPDLDGTIGPPPTDERFFDHEVRRWRPPASLRRLNLRLRRSLDELTFSFLALSPTAPASFPAEPRRARLTSPIARMKGRKAFTAIEARGGRATFDILDRTLDDDAKALLLSIERGDHVEIADAKALGEPDWWRIAGPDALRVAWRPT